MTNLAITADCNLRCRYCFARGSHRAAAAGDGPDAGMTVYRFRRLLDLLQRSGVTEARLVGGEPTLHPQFTALIDTVRDAGLKAVVFSNGLMPESALRCLTAVPADQVAVLVNALSPGHPRARDQQATLRRLGARATLGFNIDNATPVLGFLVERIVTLGLSPTLRLGLAHPVFGGANRYLHPRDYPTVGERILDLIGQATPAGVQIRCDCGFVPCMFPPGSAALLGLARDDLGHCGPIPDLLPDGSAIPCFPLARFRLAADDAGEVHAWRTRLRAALTPYRSLGLYRRCAACPERAAGRCSGGCLAAALRRLQAPSVLPLGDSPGFATVIDPENLR